MPTLLHLDSSPRAERSHSRQLTAEFARRWLAAHPGSQVVHRELGLTPLPLVSEAWIAAAYGDPATYSAEQRAAIAVSDELIDELFAADELVIGAPMYNFTVPAALKAWVDQVVRARRTFDPATYSGLVPAGKKVTVVTTRGGAGYGPGEAMAHLDAEVPYLKLILGFIGLTDVSVVYAENTSGADAVREGSLDRARARIGELTAAA